jgi:hypothetical protein
VFGTRSREVTLGSATTIVCALRIGSHATRTILGIALVGAALTGSGTGASATPSNLSQSTSGIRYVALGDSYSSGEGNPPFSAIWPSAQNCDRSLLNSWPLLLARQRNFDMTYAACSGAGIWALTGGWSAKHVGSQLSTIRAIRPAVISVTIGGNSIIQGRAGTAYPVDWGFPDVLQQCFLGGPFNNERCIKNGALATAQRAIEGISPAGSSSLEARLTRAYREISAADPKANVYVAGYPEIFPPPSATPFHCGWLGKSEQVELDQLTIDLDNVIQTATINAGVQYVSTLNALSDANGNHQLCTQESWMVPISLVNGLGASLGVDASPGHPTAKWAVCHRTSGQRIP